MTTHQIKKIPRGFEAFEPTEFDDLDLKEIPHDVAEIWYWYATVPYEEGTGNILLRTDDGLWHHHYCAHGSGDGPTEQINLKHGQPLAELLARCSDDLLEELKPLTDEIFAAGAEPRTR